MSEEGSMRRRIRITSIAFVGLVMLFISAGEEKWKTQAEVFQSAAEFPPH